MKPIALAARLLTVPYRPRTDERGYLERANTKRDADVEVTASQTPATSAAVLVVAALVFALAYCSPVATFNSDPAVALIASQALLDHHTLRIDAYRGHSGLAYDLATDTRVRSYNGVDYANSLGVPILSAPAVWLANRMGFDMLDQKAEFATQNFLSALACALLFVLLFRICRMYLGSAASLTVATVSMLGTSLMSTNATALWNSNYSLIFVSLALLHLAGRGQGRVARLNLLYLGALIALGFLCRPSTGIFGLAVVVYLLGEPDRRVALSAAATLAAIGLALAFPSYARLPWMAGHYSPGRLRLTYPPVFGLYGVLLSPSRGLFVFSPFLGLVALGGARYFRSLWSDRLFRLCTVWIGLHTFAVATNEGKWWGGHSFGPRMLVDLIPGFVLLTCIVWRRLEPEPAKVRRLATTAYLTLAVVAVAIHTGQGLFNQAPQRWNMSPNIDLDPGLAMDWRYPQFMATARQLEARWDDYERREVEKRRLSLATVAPGTPVSFDSPKVIFVHWYQAEDAWRWSRGDRASVILRLPQLEPPERLHVLEIAAGSMGSQRVGIFINGTATGEFGLSGFEPALRRVPVPGALLRYGAENIIELRVSDPSVLPDDYRQLGVSLRQLRLIALSTDALEISYADDPFFGEGFSTAESGWRWTDGSAARLGYPLGPVARESEYVLTIRARGLGAQRVEVRINGVSIGGFVAGSELASITLRLPGSLLRPDQVNDIELTLPDAVTLPNDPRRLGLAVVSVEMTPGSSDDPPR